MSHQHDVNTDITSIKNEGKASLIDKILNDYNVLLPEKEQV